MVSLLKSMTFTKTSWSFGPFKFASELFRTSSLCTIINQALTEFFSLGTLIFVHKKAAFTAWWTNRFMSMIWEKTLTPSKIITDISVTICGYLPWAKNKKKHSKICPQTVIKHPRLHRPTGRFEEFYGKLEGSKTVFFFSEKVILRPNKKRSLLRLTWLKFLRAGGRSFFLLKFFYMQMRYSNLYFSRAGNSNWASLPEERRCQSHPGCVCDIWDGWPRRSTCNELESVVSSFFGSSSAWSC